MPRQSGHTPPTFCNSRSFVKALGCVVCFSFLSFSLSALADNRPSTYVIKKGDALSIIAEQMGIGYSKLADIAAANNIDNMNLIFPGQVLELGDFIISDTEPKAQATQAKQSEQVADTQATAGAIAPELEASQTEKAATKIEAKHDQTADEQVAAKLDEQTAVEAETASIEPDTKADKPLWKFKPSFAAGFSIGQSLLDIEADSFKASDQTINLDIDDSSLNLALFIIMSLNKDFGMELALNHLGVYEFTGTIGEPVQLGISQGEQKIQAISLSAYYNKRFQHFDARINAGVMQTRHQTSGEIDLVGSAAESIDYSENSSNPFITLEAYWQIYKSWFLGPRLGWINTGDPVQSLSIRLFRPIE